jgi:bifunctional non-homologous end joining protein LigD
MGERKPDRLAKYRRMRDFSRTAEPAGQPVNGETPATGDRFVVQRHRARRRHYDLRLEMNGVLVSWAVPKGPTLDPDVRRLAVHVEDHPLEYIDFEGVIPAGEYGGGDVIVWDRGRWEPVDTDDPRDALDNGNLHFDLYGHKLAGRFVLIRPRRNDDQDNQWLLLHKHDDHATAGWDAEDHPKSVKSGRTNNEVAAQPQAMWRSDLPAAEAEVTPAGKTGKTKKSGPASKPDKKTASKTGKSGKPAQAGKPAANAKPSARTPPRQDWPPVTDEELVALDDIDVNGTWQLGQHRLKLTNLDRVLLPPRKRGRPVTKRDLIRYYTVIAPVMLPYLEQRPLNVHRFPDGVTESGFWQHQLPEHAPDWLRRWEHRKDGKTRHHLIPDSVPTLAWLANSAAVELHAWTSRAPDVDKPTWTLFDIDPGPKTSFADLLVLARLHRAALDHLDLQGRPMVTGQRGIQIWVPVAPRYGFDETRGWAETVSKSIGKTVPELVSWAWNVDERNGLARLDYTQNGSNKTLVAPYSVRPREGAPVAVPLEWDELDDPKLRPDRWTIDTVVERLASVTDPFAVLLGLEQRLPKL